MGAPVRIMDLARQMIALSGRHDVQIRVTGLRPGEKLTEALLDETERSVPCAPSVMEVVSNSPLRLGREDLERLEALAVAGRDGDVRRALFDLVAQIRGGARTAATPTLRVVGGV